MFPRRRQQPSHAVDPDILARQVAIRLLAAHPEDATPPQGPVFALTEATRLAADLHALGLLPTPPSGDWSATEAQRVLAPWNVRVVPDHGSRSP